MDITILIYICGTVVIALILALILANYWVNKYFNYLKKQEKQKRLKEDMFYQELNSKIDDLIYKQNNIIELLS